MTTDLELAFDAITKKNNDYTNLFKYYDGDQPLVYLNDRLREIFRGVNARFTENWCAVVVDAIKERLELTGLTVPTGAQETIDTIWANSQMDIEAAQVIESTLVIGEAFLIIWPDESGVSRAYYNDPRLCHAFYETANPQVMRMAAKMWVDEVDEHYYLTLYYADRLEYYRSIQKAREVHSAVGAFEPIVEVGNAGVAENIYKAIPVFHFRASKRVMKSELTNVVPLQNGINKLLSDMMVSAEYGAFRQRWVISNGSLDTLKNAPNEIWQLPAGDGVGQATQAGEFSPTDLDNYLKAISQISADIGRITRIPAHYFFGQGGDPSGEALIALEAPLNKKVKKYQQLFSPVWQKAGEFILLLAKQTTKAEDITPIWQPVETIQPKTQAEIRLYGTQAGIPLVTLLRREGWSDNDLALMASEKETASESLGDAILSQFDKGQ